MPVTPNPPRIDVVEGLQQFVTEAPTSYHAASRAAELLREAGFTRLTETDSWSEQASQPGGYVCVRDGALIAWVIPAALEAPPSFAIVGAHTDSPTFRVKPGPDRVVHGWREVATEVYGGPLLNSWLDRDCVIAGRIVTDTGEAVLVKTDAIARIPQLAIHLDREVNDGLKLDRQKQTQAVIGMEDDPSVIELVAEAAGIPAERVSGFDLFLADAQAPARIGVGGQFLASGRLDNLVSVYCGVAALLEAQPSGVIPVLAAFDHEELGSGSRTGAAGPFLESTLARIHDALGASSDDAARSIATSWCLSSDVGHSIHPNYPERHDDVSRPLAGRGPILKVNANQRYATDGFGEALFTSLCQRAGTSSQAFVSNNDVPCGSTIGPLTATRLGIRTVDIGIPILSMHSVRELAHTADIVALKNVMSVFFSAPSPSDR